MPGWPREATPGWYATTPPNYPLSAGRRCRETRALHGWSGGSGRPWEGFGGAVDRGQLAKARVRRAASPPHLPKRRRRARAPRAGGVAGTLVRCTQSTAGAFGMHSGGGSANCRRCVDASWLRREKRFYLALNGSAKTGWPHTQSHAGTTGVVGPAAVGGVLGEALARAAVREATARRHVIRRAERGARLARSRDTRDRLLVTPGRGAAPPRRERGARALALRLGPCGAGAGAQPGTLRRGLSRRRSRRTRCS